MAGTSAGSSGTLARQFVEFVMKGFDELKDALKTVRGQLQVTDQSGVTMSQHINTAIGAMANGLLSAQGRAIALGESLRTGNYRAFADETARINSELNRLGTQAKIHDTTAELLELHKALKDIEQTKASGTLAGVQANLDRMKNLRDIRTEIAAIQSSIKDGSGVQKFAAEIAIANAELSRMNTLQGARLEIAALTAALKSGAAQQFAVDMAKANAELERLRDLAKVPTVLEIPEAIAVINSVTDAMSRSLAETKARAADLAEALDDGSYVKFSADIRTATAELEKLRKKAAWDDMLASRGTIGAWSSYVVGKVNEVGGAVLGGLRGAFQQASQSIHQNLASPVAIGAAVAGFQALTQATRSWVQAGMAGTTHGNMLSMQMTLLSQQIAGIFVPTMNMVIRGIETLTGWFRALTGEQQSTIRRWIESAAVMVIVSQVVGRLTGMISGFVASLIGGALSIATTIIGTLIPAFGALVTAVTTGSGIMAASLNLALPIFAVIAQAASIVVSGLLALGTAGVVAGAGISAGTQSGRSAIASLLNAARPVIDVFRQIYAEVTRILGPTLERLGQSIGGLFARVGSVLAGLLVSAMPVITRIAEVVATIGDRIASFISRIDFAPLVQGGTLVGNVFRAAWTMIENLAAPIIRSLGMIYTMWTRIGQSVAGSGIFGVLTRWYTALSSIWESWQRIYASVNRVFDAFIRLGTAAFEPIQRILRSLGFDFSFTFEGILRVVERVALEMERIANTIENIVQRAMNLINLAGQANRGILAPRGSSEPRTDVTPAGGRFEGAMDLFRRLQETAIRSNIPQEQLNVAQQQLQAEQGILNLFQNAGGSNPSVVNVPGQVGNAASNGIAALLRQFGLV